MGAIIFGSLLLVAGVVGLLTARRSVEKFTRIADSLAPNSDHRTVLQVGTRFRWIFVVLCIVVGVGMLLAGALGALK